MVLENRPAQRLTLVSLTGLIETIRECRHCGEEGHRLTRAHRDLDRPPPRVDGSCQPAVGPLSHPKGLEGERPEEVVVLAEQREARAGELLGVGPGDRRQERPEGEEPSLDRTAHPRPTEMTVGACQSGRWLTSKEERPRLDRDELAAGGEAFSGQRVKPPEHGCELASLEGRTRLALDEPDRQVGRTSRDGVCDGLVTETLRLQVRRSPIVEVTSLVLAELRTKVVGE